MCDETDENRVNRKVKVAVDIYYKIFYIMILHFIIYPVSFYR